jgi:hypothetical protein
MEDSRGQQPAQLFLAALYSARETQLQERIARAARQRDSVSTKPDSNWKGNLPSQFE